MSNALTLPSGSRRDPRVRVFVPPARIVWTSGSGIENVEAILVNDDTLCRLTPNSGAEPPAILLDFGRELNGGVRIDIPATITRDPVQVRIRFGESVSEAMGEPNNDHTMHDYYLKVARMGHNEIGTTGFRFVRIDILEAETPVDIRSIEAVFLYRDQPWLGSFECSDRRLNDIWRTGAYTVHLCMQDHIWDGIKRDRWVWIGDMHPEAMVAATVFGPDPLVPATLDYQRDKTPLEAPGKKGWMNGISSYSLWWLIIQRDWYQRTGDLAYLSTQREYLLGLLNKLAAFIAEDGSEKMDGWRFLEWPTSDDVAATDAGLQALVTLTLQAGAELCAVLGETAAGERTAALADRAATVRRPNGSKQATALCVLAGITDANEANDAILSRDPYRGLSTFYGYYVLEARAKAGDYTGCLDLIRTYWGAMLDVGATTFWEGFELDWVAKSGRIDELTPEGKKDMHADHGGWCYQGLRHSLCHGWAAGPTAWLSEHILGVSPASPGFGSVTIQPNLGDLSWARGTVPTPHGLIEVSHVRGEDDTIQTSVSLPPGVTQVEG